MRPSEVVLSPRTPLDSPRTSSDFEEVHYPGNNWSSSRAPEELPLHYMNEDKARRRVTHPSAPLGQAVENMELDTEGKDVYTKMKQSHGGIGGGRPRRAPPPPPTSIVRPQGRYPTRFAEIEFRWSLFLKTWSTSLQYFTLSFRAGLVSTK